MPSAMIFFQIFDVFLVETFFSKLITLHGSTAAKKTVALKKAYFAPFPWKIIRQKKKKKKKVVLVVASRQKVPSLSEGHRIVFYHSFQRPRHLPHPHPGMLPTKVVIAHLTEYLVVNLEEALPHPF